MSVGVEPFAATLAWTAPDDYGTPVEKYTLRVTGAGRDGVCGTTETDACAGTLHRKASVGASALLWPCQPWACGGFGQKSVQISVL